MHIRFGVFWMRGLHIFVNMSKIDAVKKSKSLSKRWWNDPSDKMEKKHRKSCKWWNDSYSLISIENISWVSVCSAFSSVQTLNLFHLFAFRLNICINFTCVIIKLFSFLHTIGVSNAVYICCCWLKCGALCIHRPLWTKSDFLINKRRELRLKWNEENQIVFELSNSLIIVVNFDD